MTIKRKLFSLIIVPTIALFFFSLTHILDTHNSLKDQENILNSLELIKVTSSILHELQYERGLSSSYLNTKEKVFSDLLVKQSVKTRKHMDLFFNTFSKLEEDSLTNLNKEMLANLQMNKSRLITIEKDILAFKVSTEDSFNFFTDLNSNLLKVVKGIKLYSSNDETYNEIQVLKLLIFFREFAGQERALVAMHNNGFSNEDMRLFYILLSAQSNELDEINYNIQSSRLKSSFNKIYNEQNSQYLESVRENIKVNKGEKLNIEKWVKETSIRIDNYYNFEEMLFKSIHETLDKETSNLKKSVIFQVILTISTMFILLLGAYLIARSIQKSLESLSMGMNSFFDFLNFKTENVLPIEINSNDELNKLGNKINKEVLLLKLNLENDKDFISEITQISKLMKEGNFSEIPYFEPTNPNLIELKMVFNELISLISAKIKEQTKELELMNVELADEVYNQTLELEKQIVDITQARDAAVVAEKSKDDFLANMSHEIRTPLNAILGFVTILKKRIEEPTSVSYLKIIDTSGNSLLAIINDILDFSKIQSGKFTITPRNINPMLEIRNTAMLFTSKAYEKHLVFAVYIDPNLPKEICVDDTRMKQIFSNVLSNAIKFTPRDGTIKVRVFIKDEQLVISVEDSGIGIAKENMDKVFHAFEQADTSTTRLYGGTGLGLSISSRLAELMQGELSLVSAVGVGSTFTLTLPVEITDSTKRDLFDLQKVQKYKFAILNLSKDSKVLTNLVRKYLVDLNISNIVELNEYTTDGYDILFFVPDDEYNEDIVEAKIPAIAILRSDQVKLADLEHLTSLYTPYDAMELIQAIDDITVENIQDLDDENTIIESEISDEIMFSGNILVAEDNKTNQMLIKLILMDYGLDFKIANDGLEAVSMFKKEKFDLVLMDENMPNQNGLEAMVQIKKYEEENSLNHIPIIALTANALVSDVEKFLSAGMDGFVAKPIDTSILEMELSKHLKKV